MGALECTSPFCCRNHGSCSFRADDPEFADRRPHHREYLENNCTFKQVVPITNDEVTSKIHQTFKLLYLKDVVLPRVLDDNTFGSINSYVYFNNVDIVDKLRQDSDFLNELYANSFLFSPLLFFFSNIYVYIFFSQIGSTLFGKSQSQPTSRSRPSTLSRSFATFPRACRRSKKASFTSAFCLLSSRANLTLLFLFPKCSL